MAYYQIYALNAAGQIAGDSIDVVCASDRDACRVAGHALVNGARAEVRNGLRRVGVVCRPELKLIEASGQVGGRHGSGPRNGALPQATPPAGAPAPSWGRPDLFAATDLAA